MRPLAAFTILLSASWTLAACGSGSSSGGRSSTAAAEGQVGTVLFTRDLGGPVVPGPVVARDGSILAATHAGVLHALNPGTGDERWAFDGGGAYGSDLSTSPLQLPDGTILWPGSRNRLFALSARGRRLWSIDLGATGTTPVRGSRGTVYVQDVGGSLHAISASAEGGRERWRTRVGDGVSYASAKLGRDGAVLTTVGDELVSVRDLGGSGRVAWRFRAKADVEVSPAVAADGTIVLGTNDAFQYGIAPSGRERWRWKREVYTYSSPAATADGKVRFGDHRGRLITLDGPTGRLLRVDRGHGQVWGGPAVSRRGTVAFTGHPGEVFAIAASGRRVLHVTGVGLIDSTPAFGPDGTLYVGSEDGRLLALRPAADAPPPIP